MVTLMVYLNFRNEVIAYNYYIHLCPVKTLLSFLWYANSRFVLV